MEEANKASGINEGTKTLHVLITDEDGNIVVDCKTDALILSANVVGEDAVRATFFTRTHGGNIMNVFVRAIQVMGRFAAEGGTAKKLVAKKVRENTGIDLRKVKKSLVNEKD